MHPRITPGYINELSYPDFVGFINQWNTPPGAFSTVSKWATFSKIDDKSLVLDVACSTGFSSREIAVLTGCTCIGRDLSGLSVQMANYNKKKYALNTRVTYETGDGYKIESKRKFSHIVIGGNLRFFSDPKKMLAKCVALLPDAGYLLASPYYSLKKQPKSGVKRASRTLGIPSSAFKNFSYKNVMSQFGNLEIIFEDKQTLIPETKREIEYYTHSIVEKACEMHKLTDPNLYEALYRRLLKIREAINETRHYQAYVVLVLRYRKSVYPKRFWALY